MSEDVATIEDPDTEKEFSMPEEVRSPEVSHIFEPEKGGEEKRERHEEFERLVRQELERQEQAEKEKKIESSFEAGVAMLSDTYKNLQEKPTVNFQVLKTADNRYFFQGENGWQADQVGNPAMMQALEKQGMFVHYDKKGGAVEIIKDVQQTPEGTILTIESRSYLGEKITTISDDEGAYEEFNPVSLEPIDPVLPMHESPVVPEIGPPLHEITFFDAIVEGANESAGEKYGALEVEVSEQISSEKKNSIPFAEFSKSSSDAKSNTMQKEVLPVSNSSDEKVFAPFNPPDNNPVEEARVKVQSAIESDIAQVAESQQKAVPERDLLPEKMNNFFLVENEIPSSPSPEEKVIEVNQHIEKSVHAIASVEKNITTESLSPSPEASKLPTEPSPPTPDTYIVSSSERLIEATKESMETVGTTEVKDPQSPTPDTEWYSQPVIQLLETPLQEKVVQAVEQLTQNQSVTEVAIYVAPQEHSLDSALIVKREGEQIHLTLLETEESAPNQVEEIDEAPSIIIENIASGTAEKIIELEVEIPMTEKVDDEPQITIEGALSKTEQEPLSTRNSRLPGKEIETTIIQEEENIPTPVTPISLSFSSPSLSPSSARSSQRANTAQAA